MTSKFRAGSCIIKEDLLMGKLNSTLLVVYISFLDHPREA